jgi:hypothetical protein
MTFSLSDEKYWAHLVAHLGELDWRVELDHRTGDFCLTRESPDRTVPIEGQDVLSDRYGVTSGGQVGRIVRRFDPTELRAVIPKLGETFGLPLKRDGVMGIDASGNIRWGRSGKEGQYKLYLGRRVIELHKEYYAAEMFPPQTSVLLFDERGDVVCPIGGIMMRLAKWGDLVVERAKALFAQDEQDAKWRGSGDKLVAAFGPDGSIAVRWEGRGY